MIKSGFSPNFSTGDSFFATPLHYAANSRNLKLVHTLVKEGNAKVDESVINMCLFPMDVRDIEISIYLINVMEKKKNNPLKTPSKDLNFF